MNLLIALLFFLIGGVLLQGLVKLPADPPYVGVVTRWGEKIAKLKKEGWRFFLLRKILYDFIPINVQKVNQDLEPQAVYTPDKTENSVLTAITWTPDYRSREELAGTPEYEEYPEDWIPLHSFINYGKHHGVQDVLSDIVTEQLRRWAFADNEGPQNWEEAMASQDEATLILLRAIVGRNQLTPIPSNVPTPVLFKYFASPKIFPTSQRDKERWGEKWEKVETLIEEDSRVIDYDEYLNNQERQREELARYQSMLKRLVRGRQMEILSAQRGNGSFRIPNLGIVINRLNVEKILPLGAVKEAADLKAKEKLEQQAEEVEISHAITQIGKLAEQTGMPVEEATRVFQVERGKVEKVIRETEISLSPETKEVAQTAFNALLRLLSGGGRG